MTEDLIQHIVGLCISGTICLLSISFYIIYKLVKDFFNYDNQDYKIKYYNLKKEIEAKKLIDKDKTYTEALKVAYENGIKEGKKRCKKK